MSEPTVEIAELAPSQLSALRAFLESLPDEDVTFIKEEVREPAVAEAWVNGGGSSRRWVAVSGGEVLGLVMVVPLTGWSSHVGSLRLVVAAAARGRGIGRALARYALREAVDMGLSKLVVEVVAEQESAVRLFDELGFRGEALLTAHIRDRAGQLRDLLMLSHDVGEEWSAMASLGIEHDLG